MDIGTLTGAIQLENNLSGQLDRIGRDIFEFATDTAQRLAAGEASWAAYASAATLAGGAVVAAAGLATGAIVAMGTKGAEIQSVTDSFDRLAEQAGSTGEALREGLLEGTKRTVDDLDLMKSTTRLLSSGIKLTAADMRVMGATAREMGKATGTDATQGLQTLSQALMTGQTRLLRRYGIQIDTIQAEMDYAKQLGTTRNELNQTEKVEAARIAMLDGMRTKLEVLGETEVDFGEKLMQGTQVIDDWFDKLFTGVAKSPHVMSAVDAIGDALVNTFGDSSQTLLDNILYGIDNFADAVTTYAPEVITELGNIKDAFVGLYETIRDSSFISGIKDLNDWLNRIQNHPVFKYLIGDLSPSGVIRSTKKDLSLFQSPIQTARDYKAFEDKISKPFQDLFEDIMLGPVESKKIQDFSTEVEGLTENLSGLRLEATAVGKLNIPNVITGGLTGEGVVAGAGKTGVIGGITAAARGPSREALRETAEQQKFLNNLMGVDALEAAQKYEKALLKVGGATKFTAGEQRQFDKVFEDVIDKYKALGPSGASVVRHFEQVKFEFDTATMGAKNFNLAMYAVPNALKPVGDTMDILTSSTIDFGSAMIGLGPKIEHTNEVVKSSFLHDSTLGEKLISGLTVGVERSIERIPQIISNGIVNGADWSRIGMAVGTEVGAAVGEEIGATIGTALGGEAGGRIGGAIGQMAGSFVSLIGDALHRSAGEDVMRRVGRDWGIGITEEMGDTIAEQAKTMFRGSRQAAEIFNLDTLLAAGGGLSPDNLDTMTHKLRDVFSMLDSGLFTSSQAAKVLDDNFGAFADQFGEGIISQGLREIVSLTQQAGVNSKAIGEFLSKQAQRARGGLEGILGQSLRFTQEGGQTTDQFAGVVTQEQFDRLSRLATVSFQAAIAAGEPFLDVIEEMQGSFGKLNEAVDQFGFQQNAAFADVSAISAFFDKNEALGDSIQGTNEMLVALANSNLLTQQSFSDLGAIAVENYNAMIKGGLSNQQALLSQQDTLQTLWELINEGTFTVDDQTQALIDQAKEAGLVGEAHMDAQERATAAMESAAEAMQHVGDVLSQVFGIAGDEAETFADRTVAAAKRAAAAMAQAGPNIIDPNKYTQGDLGPSVQFEAEGGFGTVRRPTVFVAGEAGTEDFAFSGGGRTFGDVLGGSNNAALTREIQGLRGDLETYQRLYSRIVRDELLTSPKR